MWLRLANFGPAAQTDGRQAILRLHPSSRNTLACRVYTCERPPALPYHDEAAFESFFAHDAGLSLKPSVCTGWPSGVLAERAYWAAVAHLCRGQPGISWDLFRFAVSRRPTIAILPPVGYLFRRHDTSTGSSRSRSRWCDDRGFDRAGPADRTILTRLVGSVISRDRNIGRTASRQRAVRPCAGGDLHRFAYYYRWWRFEVTGEKRCQFG